jgi:hypothetical protein
MVFPEGFEGKSGKSGLIFWVSVFHPFWEEWVNSDHCQLTQRQLKIIDYCFEGKTCAEMSEALNLSPDRVHQLINITINRLQTGWLKRHKFHADRILQENNILELYSKQERILLKPLTAHSFSTRTYNILRRLGDSLWDIVYDFNEEQLKSIHGLGEKSLQEVKDVLDEHDCLYKLK